MNFTFGIITSGDSDDFIRTIIQSISNQNIPPNKYEIIIVGNTKISSENQPIKIIEFNENTNPPKWITRKKNIITQNSNMENIVFMHDYIKLENNWYEAFKKYGNNWDIAMSKVYRLNGNRGLDWVLSSSRPKSISHGNIEDCRKIDYKDKTKNEYQYIPGNYWIAKKYVMEKEPLDEKLSWNQKEDVEWSNRVLPKYKFVMVEESSVSHLKMKHGP